MEQFVRAVASRPQDVVALAAHHGIEFTGPAARVAFPGWRPGARRWWSARRSSILAEIPAAQQPEPGKTARRSLGGVGYISRHILFLQPDGLAPRALWLYAVPAGHAYDFRPPHDRVGAGPDARRDRTS